MNDNPDLEDVKRIVQQGYGQVALDYARLEGRAEWPRMRWLKKLLDRLEPGSSVLDLGCGSGTSRSNQFFPLDLVPRPAGEREQMVVAKGDIALDIQHHGGELGRFHHFLETMLALLQRLLGPFAFGDVFF